MQPAVITPALVDIITILKQMTGQGKRFISICRELPFTAFHFLHSDDQEMMAMPLLCVLIFQTHVMNSWSTQAVEAVNRAALKVSLWISFKIARSAARSDISIDFIHYF